MGNASGFWVGISPPIAIISTILVLILASLLASAYKRRDDFARCVEIGMWFRDAFYKAEQFTSHAIPYSRELEQLRLRHGFSFEEVGIQRQKYRRRMYQSYINEGVARFQDLEEFFRDVEMEREIPEPGVKLNYAGHISDPMYIRDMFAQAQQYAQGDDRVSVDSLIDEAELVRLEGLMVQGLNAQIAELASS